MCEEIMVGLCKEGREREGEGQMAKGGRSNGSGEGPEGERGLGGGQAVSKKLSLYRFICVYKAK